MFYYIFSENDVRDDCGRDGSCHGGDVHGDGDHDDGCYCSSDA